MIQFNLLPNIKQDYIRAEKLKRTVTSISVIVIIICVSLVLIILALYTTRGSHLDSLNKDISTARTDLEETNDINKVLTIQNQLNALPNLHKGKPESSRMFNYLAQITPGSVAINEFEIDFTENKVTIKGVSPTIAAINEYADTLKFTKFSTIVYEDDEAGAPAFAFDGSSEEEGPKKTDDEGNEITSIRYSSSAFDQVVLDDFASEDDGITYEIIAVFDPIMFEDVRTIRLDVPRLTTTRSEIEKPTFVEKTDDDENGGDQ